MVKKVKVIKVLWCYLLLLQILTSCGTPNENADEQTEATTNVSMFFLDKTLSAEIDTLILGETIKKAQEVLVRYRFSGFNDKVKGFYIHANTSSNSPIINKVVNIPYPNTKKMGGIDKKRAEREYARKVNKLRAELLDDINRAFFSRNPDPTNRQTDLWAVFELMSDYFEQSSPEDDRLVIIVSDMIESMRGPGRRNFHSKPIKNKAEAEAMAKEDAQWIKNNLAVDPANLQNVKIRVWPPITTTEKSNFQNVRYYWDALFGEFGLTEVSYFE